MIFGKEKVIAKMKEIDNAGNAATPKDKNMYPILELVLEMYERGIKFLPIDLYKSHATKFIMEDEGIRPPLSALTGFGEVDAEKLVKAREEGVFTSIEQKIIIACKIYSILLDKGSNCVRHGSPPF